MCAAGRRADGPFMKLIYHWANGQEKIGNKCPIFQSRNRRVQRKEDVLKLPFCVGRLRRLCACHKTCSGS